MNMHEKDVIMYGHVTYHMSLWLCSYALSCGCLLEPAVLSGLSVRRYLRRPSCDVSILKSQDFRGLFSLLTLLDALTLYKLAPNTIRAGLSDITRTMDSPVAIEPDDTGVSAALEKIVSLESRLRQAIQNSHPLSSSFERDAASADREREALLAVGCGVKEQSWYPCAFPTLAIHTHF